MIWTRGSLLAYALLLSGAAVAASGERERQAQFVDLAVLAYAKDVHEQCQAVMSPTERVALDRAWKWTLDGAIRAFGATDPLIAEAKKDWNLLAPGEFAIDCSQQPDRVVTLVKSKVLPAFPAAAATPGYSGCYSGELGRIVAQACFADGKSVKVTLSKDLLQCQSAATYRVTPAKGAAKPPVMLVAQAGATRCSNDSRTGSLEGLCQPEDDDELVCVLSLYTGEVVDDGLVLYDFGEATTASGEVRLRKASPRP